MAGLGLIGNNPNKISIIIGFAILSPLIIYVIIDIIKSNKQDRIIELSRTQFIKQAKKHVVNIEDFTIRTNSWQQTNDNISNPYPLFDHLLGRSDKNITRQNLRITEILFKLQFSNQIIFYRMTDSRDPETLKMKILSKKTTNLYVGTNDEVYLDLDFLG